MRNARVRSSNSQDDDRCSYCNGDKYVVCDQCQGLGSVDYGKGPETCRKCHGGHFVTCPRCHGSGNA